MPTMHREELIAQAVLDLAVRPDGFDVLELLHDLTMYAVKLLDVRSAGITILDEAGQVDYVTASDETCRRLEEDQLELDEGPCVDSARTGTALPTVPLRADHPSRRRWPRFAPRAVAAGITCVAAVPMGTPQHPLGALNLLSTERVPTREELSLAQVLVDAAGACLQHRQTLLARDEIIRQLETALESRIVIEQAKGVLASRLGVDVEEAFTRMRRHARSRQQKLTQLAAQRCEMPSGGRDAASGAAPPPHDGLREFMARAHRDARSGHAPDTSVPPGTARYLGLDALTLNMLARDGHLEPLWCDPDKGLGLELDDLQYTLGDGPTLEAAQHGRTLAEPDLSAADPARWPLFLPAAAHTPLCALIATPLRLGAATIGVLTGYRTTPGPLAAAHLHDLHRLGRNLTHLLITHLTTPANDTGLRLHRAEIHQATGFLAAELGIPLGQALLRLRAHAATHNQPLTDLAHALLTHRLPPDTLTPAN